MVKESERLEIPDDTITEESPLKQDAETTKPKKSFGAKCAYAISNVTVEPCLLLFVVAFMVNINATQNLNLEKACRVNLNYNDSICHSLKMQDLESENEYEKETQKILASALTFRTYLSATIPCFIALFTGSFSDKTGYRKFFIAQSIIGQILIGFNAILNVYFLKEVRLEVFVLTDALLEGLSGGWCSILLASFSYIGAITTDKTRTFRLGISNFSVTVAFPVGMGVSGILLKKYGYYAAYGLGTCLNVINLVYILFVLKDPQRSAEQKRHDGKGIVHLIRTFFDFKNVKDTVRVIYKKAPNNRRVRMCVLLAVVCVLFGPMYGEITVLYMSTRLRFQWDEVQFSYFQTYNFITHTVGTVFSLVVLSKYLQWHDSLLGIISTVSKIAASFVYAFATTAKIFYIAPLIEILNGTSLLAMRSICSKLVEPNELGSINSVIGLTENLMPLIYVPLYTQVYAATIEVLPGAVFLVGAGLTLPAVFVLSYLFYEHRKQVRKSKSEVKTAIAIQES